MNEYFQHTAHTRTRGTLHMQIFSNHKNLNPT